ncbi:MULTISPECIES: P1 family peptidase [unclassified Actinopolyspora]|uniref:P1 family peptidase n=1 Tax=unclassified Actinopolyspora TaxID=2639451 RepID=UPI0013F6860D|nr:MULTISPECIES: P1 family peptidase [unclassified Actinopolyspora]NHD18066.1 P1 family peptidase [Actinopolyspora sp. BKK2]NHE78611.1 P1 family peptidase [Actinopolyspora sp. BKK1]
MVESFGRGSGANNAITDVAGVSVGHRHRLDERWATGSTVVLTPEGAAAGVDVRGAGPGTRETDVLDPDHLAQLVHGVLLGGGSAFGLSAADGAMRWLAERGHGLRVGSTPHEVVPIVPAAVLFDLPMSDWGRRPDATFGYAACEGRSRGVPATGNVGAGTGAVAGALKGGVGTASAVLEDGTTVGALIAVNSSGAVVDPSTGLPWALSSGLEGEFDVPAPSAEAIAAARARNARTDRSGAEIAPLNTTIGVVATDAGFGKPECRRVAVAAHDGVARAVRPAHGMTDGDTVFALATGERSGAPAAGEPGWVAALDAVCAAAAEVTARAIVHAVLAAESVAEVPGYTSLYHPERE